MSSSRSSRRPDLQLYWTRRNLNGSPGHRHGRITPLVERTSHSARWPTTTKNVQGHELPMAKEGALPDHDTRTRISTLPGSSVTPLEMEGARGRCAPGRRLRRGRSTTERGRITVRHARTKEFLPPPKKKSPGQGDIGRTITVHRRARPDLRGRWFVARGAAVGHRSSVLRETPSTTFYRGGTS